MLKTANKISNQVSVIRQNCWGISKIRRHDGSVRPPQYPSVVLMNIIRIFQEIPGKNRHDI